MFFLDQKVINIDFKYEVGRGFQKNMAAIKQHAIMKKKERVKVCFFFPLSLSPYSCFCLNLGHMVMPHMCCEMQRKLSKSRVHHLGLCDK